MTTNININNRLSLIRIDHRNSLKSFNQDSLAEFKYSLYSQLEELDEVETNFIFKYLEKTYFSGMHKNEFLKITSKLIKKLPNSQENNNIEANINNLNDLIQKENNILILNENSITEISLIIKNNFTEIENKFRIKSELVFLKKINKIRYKFDNLENGLNLLNDETSLSNDIQERRSTCESFQTISKLNESLNSISENRISYYHKLKILEKTNLNHLLNKINSAKNLKQSQIKSSFNTNNDTKNKEKLLLPINLVKLIEIFHTIKKIKISLPKNKNNYIIYFYLIVLINLRWLLPNTCEISIDLQSDLHKNQIGFINKKSEINPFTKSLYKVVSENKIILELMIFIPYFFSIFTNLKKNQIEFLNLNISDSYQIELDFLLKVEKVFMDNFHILDTLEFSTNLKFLNLSFNSLDSNTLKRVISIIHRNNNLQELNLNIFPEENDFVFNTYSVSKICNLNDVNLTTVKGNYFYYSNYVNNISCIIDENENILNALSLQFENNLENLIYILSRKIHNLSSLKIQFNIPNIFFISDKYANAFHKFIMNLFSLLDTNNLNESTLGKSNVKNLEIVSNNFTLNSKKYPFINEYLDKLNLKENKILKKMKLNFKFNKIFNIENILPKRIKFLSLYELDNLTFEKFVNIFKNEKNYFNYLEIIDISLSKLYFNLDEKSLIFIYEFFTLNKGKKIQEINFNFQNLYLDEEKINKILSIIYKSKIIKYNFKISTKNISQNFISNWNEEKTLNILNTDTKKLTSLIFSLNRFDIFKIAKNTINIIKIINKFLLKKNQKLIIFDFK